MGHRVLVPVAVLDGETVPEALFAVLSPLPVVVLGYHVVPEQTVPGQARLQFEERAQASLAEIAEVARGNGCPTETRLVFTHEEEQTIRRVAAETGCDSILVPNPTAAVDRVLVSLRGGDDPDHVAAVVAAFLADDDVPVTLLHVVTEAGESDRVRRARATLVEHGIDAERIETRAITADSPVSAIANVAADYDLVVMGETAPSVREYVFGDDHQRVADRSLGPVLVVGTPGEQ